MKYRCNVCNVYEYNDAIGDVHTKIKPGAKPGDFPDSWECPICGADKTHLQPVEEAIKEKLEVLETSTCPRCGRTHTITVYHEDLVDLNSYLGEWKRSSDELETHMADIHRMSATVESVIEPMRTRKDVISWDDVLIRGAQLARLPLNSDKEVNTRTVIGQKARHPLVIESPVFITHMSFGALSREIKIALAKGSAASRTATCSGEGGILEQERECAYKYIFEYVPNEYSVTPENLRASDAIEIKIGQSAKPGMGGHLPAEKVTSEIAAIRGFPEGTDIVSPARFRDVSTPDDLRKKVDWLREASGGRPIGIKLAAGSIEADLEVAVHAAPDFITIDGRAGATAASPKYIKLASAVPTIYALHRARKFLDEKGASDISLVITGGLRVSSDFVKALAMGADAIAIGTAALMAAACQQYRLCDTGKCPVGVTTQDPVLRARLRTDISARKLENFLCVSNRELMDFARMTGNDDVHGLSVSDLCTDSREMSEHTAIEHV